MVNTLENQEYKSALFQEPQSVAFYTLGCKANQLESSALADTFRAQGWRVIPHTEKASLYIINTCTVTGSGDSESRRMIRRLKRQNPEAMMAVTGCYAQVSPDEIAAIAGVNYVIGNNFKQDVYRIITENPPQESPLVAVSEIDKSRIMTGATVSSINRTRASLKIQDGCDFKCTYCIIWVARGPSRSLSVDVIREQLQDLIQQGYTEIVLTGINIGQYQDEDGVTLAGLLQELLVLPGQFRLRLSSLDPAEVTPELLRVMASTDKLCPYLHLSLQSAEDHVLKRMARRHRVKDLHQVCAEIIHYLPQACIGADVIVGFPEETPERFESTFQTLTALPLAYFHTFSYSKREGTPAAEFEDQVSEPEKKERTRRLIRLSEEKNLAYRTRFLNQTLTVIVEESLHKGITENYIPVQFEKPSPEGWRQNDVIRVSITQVDREMTWGTVISWARPII
jgi:threonylcarbamoyladenosine tRNA methylthiotransferase MtaB